MYMEYKANKQKIEYFLLILNNKPNQNNKIIKY